MEWSLNNLNTRKVYHLPKQRTRSNAVRNTLQRVYTSYNSQQKRFKNYLRDPTNYPIHNYHAQNLHHNTFPQYIYHVHYVNHVEPSHDSSEYATTTTSNKNIRNTINIPTGRQPENMNTQFNFQQLFDLIHSSSNTKIQNVNATSNKKGNFSPTSLKIHNNNNQDNTITKRLANIYTNLNTDSIFNRIIPSSQTLSQTQQILPPKDNQSINIELSLKGQENINNQYNNDLSQNFDDDDDDNSNIPKIFMRMSSDQEDNNNLNQTNPEVYPSDKISTKKKVNNKIFLQSNIDKNETSEMPIHQLENNNYQQINQSSTNSLIQNILTDIFMTTPTKEKENVIKDHLINTDFNLLNHTPKLPITENMKHHKEVHVKNNHNSNISINISMPQEQINNYSLSTDANFNHVNHTSKITNNPITNISVKLPMPKIENDDGQLMRDTKQSIQISNRLPEANSSISNLSVEEAAKVQHENFVNNLIDSIYKKLLLSSEEIPEEKTQITDTNTKITYENILNTLNEKLKELSPVNNQVPIITNNKEIIVNENITNQSIFESNSKFNKKKLPENYNLSVEISIPNQENISEQMNPEINVNRKNEKVQQLSVNKPSNSNINDKIILEFTNTPINIASSQYDNNIIDPIILTSNIHQSSHTQQPEIQISNSPQSADFNEQIIPNLNSNQFNKEDLHVMTNPIYDVSIKVSLPNQENISEHTNHGFNVNQTNDKLDELSVKKLSNSNLSDNLPKLTQQNVNDGIMLESRNTPTKTPTSQYDNNINDAVILTSNLHQSSHKQQPEILISNSPQSAYFNEQIIPNLNSNQFNNEDLQLMTNPIYDVSVKVSLPHQENITEHMNPEINVNKTNDKLEELSVKKHSNSNLSDNLPKPTQENVNDGAILEFRNTTTKTLTPQYDNNINDQIILTSNLHQSSLKQQPEFQVSNSPQSADFNEQINPNLNSNQFNKEYLQVMTNPIYDVSVKVSLPHQENITEHMNPEFNVNKTNDKLEELSVKKHSNSNLSGNLPKPTQENVNDGAILEFRNTTTKTLTPQYDNNINDQIILTSNLHQSSLKQQPEFQVSNSLQSADFNEQINPNLNSNQFNKEYLQVMTNPIYDVSVKVSLPHQENITEHMNPEFNVNKTNDKLEELSVKKHSNSNLSDNLPKPTQENVNDGAILEFRNTTTKTLTPQYDNNINDQIILTSNLHQSSLKQQPKFQVSNSPQSADFNKQINPNLNSNQFNKEDLQVMTNAIYDVSVKVSLPHQENITEHMNPEFNVNKTNDKLEELSVKKHSNSNLSDNLPKPTQENVNDGAILEFRNTTTKTLTPQYDNNINDQIILTSNLHQSSHKQQPEFQVSNSPQSADFNEQINPNLNSNQFNKEYLQVMTNPIYDVSVKLSIPDQENISEHMNPEFNVNKTNDKLEELSVKKHSNSNLSDNLPKPTQENVNDGAILEFRNTTTKTLTPQYDNNINDQIILTSNLHQSSLKQQPKFQVSNSPQSADFNKQINPNLNSNQFNKEDLQVMTNPIYDVSVKVSLPHQENITEHMNPEFNVNKTNDKLEELSVKKHSNSNLSDNLPKPTQEKVNDGAILEFRNTTTKTLTPQYDNNINDQIILTSNLHQSIHKQQPEFQVSNSPQSADFNGKIIPNININQFNKEGLQVMANPIYDVSVKVSIPHQEYITEHMNPEFNVNKTNDKLEELSVKKHSNSNLSDNLPKPTQENVNDGAILEFRNTTTKTLTPQYDNNINDQIILTSNLHQSIHKQQPEFQVSNSPQSADFNGQIIPNININQFNKEGLQVMANPIYDVSVKLSIPDQEDISEHMNPEINVNKTNDKLEELSVKKHSNSNLSDNLPKPTQENVNDGAILEFRNTTTKTLTTQYDNNINDQIILTSNLHQSSHKQQPEILISNPPQSAYFNEQINHNLNSNQFNKEDLQVMTNAIYDVSVKVSLPHQVNITEHMIPEFNVNKTNDKLEELSVKKHSNSNLSDNLPKPTQENVNDGVIHESRNTTTKTPTSQYDNNINDAIILTSNLHQSSHKQQPEILISNSPQSADFNGQIIPNININQFNKEGLQVMANPIYDVSVNVSIPDQENISEHMNPEFNVNQTNDKLEAISVKKHSNFNLSDNISHSKIENVNDDITLKIDPINQSSYEIDIKNKKISNTAEKTPIPQYDNSNDQISITSNLHQASHNLEPGIQISIAPQTQDLNGQIIRNSHTNPLHNDIISSVRTVSSLKNDGKNIIRTIKLTPPTTSKPINAVTLPHRKLRQHIFSDNKLSRKNIIRTTKFISTTRKPIHTVTLPFIRIIRQKILSDNKLNRSP